MIVWLLCCYLIFAVWFLFVITLRFMFDLDWSLGGFRVLLALCGLAVFWGKEVLVFDGFGDVVFDGSGVIFGVAFGVFGMWFPVVSLFCGDFVTDRG